MTTPYITPDILRAFPSGLDLSTVPFPGATQAQQEAELTNVCVRVTSEIVNICGQELRATFNTDTEVAPGWRVSLNGQGVAEMRLRRFPILQLLSAAVSPARQFPRQFTVVPIDQVALKNSVPGELGTVAPDSAAIGPDTALFAPGFINWRSGSGGYVIQLSYLNGWPHCGLTDDAFAHDVHLSVDDCTGWIGVIGTLFDGASTEQVRVIATSTAYGPGILTLDPTTPLAFDHTNPVPSKLIFSALPADIQTAACFLAIEQLLVRGATAVTVPSLPGAEVHTGRDSGDLKQAAKAILSTYAVTTW